MRLAKCGHPTTVRPGPIPKLCEACKGVSARPRRFARLPEHSDTPDIPVDTATLMRLSIRFANLRTTASTANLSGLWSGICASLGRGDPEDFQRAAFDMAAELVVLADQRAR